jgi:hypothetical protein
VSIQLPSNRKFTEAERAYAIQIGREDLVDENDRSDLPAEAPAKDSNSDVLHLDQDIYDRVVNLNQDQLQAELRSMGVDPVGNESELRTELASRLQNQRDAKK